MAPDKLPDPLPLRHWKQWGGRAICRQWDTYIRLHPFLSDGVSAALIRTAPSLGPPDCRGWCPEHSATPQPWNHSGGKAIQPKSFQLCHTESCPRPLLSPTGLQYQAVVLPVSFSDQPEVEAALVSRQVLFAWF